MTDSRPRLQGYGTYSKTENPLAIAGQCSTYNGSREYLA